MTDFIVALKIIIIGIVEGITEWLPVSSTGHMIIFNSFFKLDEYFSSSYWEMFLVVIQFGAILAVVCSFFNQLWPFGKNKSKEEKKEIWMLWLKILIGCVPAGIIGVLLDDILNQYLYNFITVSITLIVYGIIFILIEIFVKKGKIKENVTQMNNLTFKIAFIIGLAQILALIPGTSRSGITIVAGMLIGCSRNISLKYSFFLSIPIMIGASLLKCVKYFGIEKNTMTSFETEMLILGMAVAFLVSLICIKFLTSFVKTHTFKGFGYYRIILGCVMIILFVTVFKNDTTLCVTNGISNIFNYNLGILNKIR